MRLYYYVKNSMLLNFFVHPSFFIKHIILSSIKHTPIRFKIFTKQYNILLTQSRYNILSIINKKSIFAFLAYGTWTNTNSENTLYTAPNFVNLEGKINYSCELYIVLNVHVNKYYPRFIINILRFIILYYKQEFFFLNHFNMNSISAYLFFLSAVFQLIE